MRYAWIFILISVFSCKEDITPPVIRDLALNGSIDTLHLNLDTSQKIHLYATIEDDTELSQYRVFSANSITAAPSDSSLFSNYVTSIYNSIETNPFVYNDSLELSNFNSTGVYTVNLSAIDVEGNEGLGESVVLVLYSSEAPNTLITQPDFSSSFPSFNAGDTLFFQGTVSDNVAIRSISLEILNTGSIVSQTFSYSDTVFTSWDYGSNSAKLAIPSSAEIGNYEVRVKLVDNDGNLTLFRDSITVN